MRVGLYPGSFDPVTFGHLDILQKAGRLVDRLVIAIGTHHDKRPLFSLEDRIGFLQELAVPLGEREGFVFDVITYDGLTVEAARAARASLIIRGLRNAADFDYEIQMAGMNGALAPEIETVFLAATPRTRHVAASLVRQIAAFGGDVSGFVPPSVAEALKRKLSR